MVFMVLGMTCFALTAGRRYGHLSPIGLFVYVQGVMAVGVFTLLDSDLPADVLHANLLLACGSAVILTAIFCTFVTQIEVRKRFLPTVHFSYPRGLVALLLVASIAISVVYYINVGYLAFIEAMRSIVSGVESDISGLRLESYAGSRYLFPGYVNQFKNAILPALSFVVIAAAYREGTRWRHVLSALIVVTNLILLFGTGQRSPFVRALIVLAITLYIAFPRRSRTSLLWIAIVSLPLFFVATVATGRAGQDLAEADGLLDVAGVFFTQLMFRIFGSSQLAAVRGFQWIEAQSIPFGSEWGQGLVGLLPGRDGPDTANQIHALLYGSTRGTAPLSLLGSAYYNFGFAGTVILVVLLAVLLCEISQAILRRESWNLVQASGAAGVTMALGLWISDGPTTPLNGGLGVYVVLWLWGNALERRTKRET